MKRKWKSSHAGSLSDFWSYIAFPRRLVDVSSESATGMALIPSSLFPRTPVMKHPVCRDGEVIHIVADTALTAEAKRI